MAELGALLLTMRVELLFHVKTTVAWFTQLGTALERSLVLFVSYAVKMNIERHITRISSKVFYFFAQIDTSNVRWSSALSHGSWFSQTWNQYHTPAFTGKEDWSVKKFVLIPLYFFVWPILKAMVCDNLLSPLDSLNSRMCKKLDGNERKHIGAARDTVM